MTAKGIDEHFECSLGSNVPGVTTTHLGRASAEEEESQTVQCRSEAVLILNNRRSKSDNT